MKYNYQQGNVPVTLVALESIKSETGRGAGGAGGGDDESIPDCCMTSVSSLYIFSVELQYITTTVAVLYSL